MLATLLGLAVDAVLELEMSIGLNALFSLRGVRTPPEQIVIVAMDEASETALGLGEDLPAWRDHHAKLIQQLKAQKAALVVFDLQFIKPNAKHDPVLAKAIRSAGNVLVSECVQKFRYGNEDFFGREECSAANKQPAVRLESQASAATALSEQLVVMRKIPPYPLLAKAVTDHAPFHLIKDVTGSAVREAWLYFDGMAETPSLPLVIWLHSLLANQSSHGFLADGQRASDWLVKQRRACLADPIHYDLSIALPPEQWQPLRQIICGAASQYLDFYGPPKTFRMESYSDVYLGKVTNLTGKIVLVGKASRQFQSNHIDTFETPFSDSHVGKMAGVEIMATQVANLLENRRLSMPFPIAVPLFVYGLLILCLLTIYSGWPGIALSLMASGGYAVFCEWRFANHGMWLPIATPLLIQLPLSWLLSLYASRRALVSERKRLMAFANKVFPQWGGPLSTRSSRAWFKNPQAMELVAERNVTGICMATDIESYTHIATLHSSHETWQMLNAYYQVLGQPVTENGGIIADVTGDSMMAVWLSESATQRRLSACTAALAMAEAIDRYNATSGLEPMITRIGLFEGEMTLGELDTGVSSHFRAVGDTVNTASRIQGVNKQLGTRILASQNVIDGLDQVNWRALGHFHLVGRSEPVALVEIIGRPKTIDNHSIDHCQFEQAMLQIANAEWQAACELLNVYLIDHPGDGPALFYLTLASQYSTIPNPDWQGVVTLDQK